MSTLDYTDGLHQVADGVWAWLQPDGGWGLSNAGLVDGGGHSLLVDTQFDLPRTRRMLAAMAPVTHRSPIRDAVNTHGNGDHCFGNGLLEEAVRIWAAPEAGAHLQAESPQLLAGLMGADLDPQLSDYLHRAFGAFEFSRHHHPAARLAGDRRHRPRRRLAHRPAAAAGTGAHPRRRRGASYPDSGVVFAGDLLFIGGTPIMWAGPAGSWIAALHRLLDLDAEHYVPGHGPVTDAAGVREVIDYLAHVEAGCRRAARPGPHRAAGGRRARAGTLRRLGQSGAGGDQRRQLLPGAGRRAPGAGPRRAVRRDGPLARLSRAARGSGPGWRP